MRQKYSKILAYQALGIRQAFFGLTNVLVQEIESRKETASQRLGEFQKPVIIIFGDNDHDLNKGVAKDFHSLFPRSTLHIVKNAGHFVQIDRPKEVAKYIFGK